MTIAGFVNMAACRIFLVSLAFLLLIDSVYSWIPRVVNGRPKGGKLRAPKAPAGVRLPSPMWFEDQKLDHFDGSNYKTWKQVIWGMS